MPSIRKIVDGKVLQAYGTSEGVSKAWDTRGRGRKAKPTSSNKSRIASSPNNKLRILPADELRILPADEDTPKPPLTPAKVTQGKQIVSRYQKLGDEIMKAHEKLEHADQANTLWGKFLHLLKSVGDWFESYEGLSQLATGGSLLGMLHNYIAKGAHTSLAALHLAFHSVSPWINHLSLYTGVHSNYLPHLLHSADYKSGHSTMRALADGKSFMAYGTSEGVTKEWDSRGRGRHKEYGNFDKDGERFGGKVFHTEKYRANNSHVVFQQDGKGNATVSEGQFGDKDNTVYKGFEQNARTFMRNRYGIGAPEGMFGKL